MKYENEVYSKMELVNSVFKSLDIPSMETNKDFAIDELFHQEHGKWLAFLTRCKSSFWF